MNESATTTNAILIAQNLTKIYRGAGENIAVFAALNFALARGEMVAILGASGAGKSTLLHLLGGLDYPTSGTVQVDNFDIFKNSDVELARVRNQKVGFVFQFHHLLPEFSALENVMMPLLISGKSRNEAIARAQHLLQRVGLQNRAAHRPGAMSGGERQRVALARALATAPVLLLADEPTGNLDQSTSAAIFTLLCELHAEEKLSSVIVTHNEQLAATCDRVLHLANGQLT